MNINEFLGRQLVSRRGSETVRSVTTVERFIDNLEFDDFWWVKIKTVESPNPFFVRVNPYLIFVCGEQSS